MTCNKKIFRRRIISSCSEPIDKLVLEDNQWRKVAYLKYKLEIKDVSELQFGDKLRLLILGDNMNRINQNKICDPKSYFKYNFATYVHSHELTGTLILHLANSDITIEDFEFDIESNGEWYSLIGGYLSATFICWTKLSPSTAIGYRGPFILKSALRFLPNIIGKFPQRMHPM